MEALGKQIVNRLDPADGSIQHDLHAQFPQILYLGVDDALWEAKFRDTVDEHTA